MSDETRCPLCGNNAIQFGDMHSYASPQIYRAFICTKCKYKYLVDENGNIKSPD